MKMEIADATSHWSATQIQKLIMISFFGFLIHCVDE